MSTTQIRGQQIANNAIDASKIVDDSLTSADIKDGTIVDADINVAAGIADTKLGTIQTTGKVLNSATSAASASTPSAIVARDSNGDFSANVITSTLDGKFKTARTISISGGMTGSAQFDGSQNIDIDVSATGVAMLDGQGKISEEVLPSLDGGSA